MKITKICTGMLLASALLMPANLAAAKTAPAAAAVPAPPAGKGQIVFFRPGTIMGAAMRCTIRENGKMVGRLMRGKYIVAVTEPGKHAYTTKTEATDTLNVNVEPDETQYVSCKIGAGFAAGRSNLAPSNKADFDSKAAKLKPVDASELAKLIAEDDGK